MISQVILQDFQAHKNSVFNFDKGLNVVTGAGHEGKTSLIRALSLVLYNTWDKSWVNWDALFCRVTIITDLGIIVIREKGEKVNKYILKIPNQSDQVFANFGVEVPEVVSKALKISKVVLDKDDSLTLNYSGQLEPLFLFNRSGSQKAKVFGRLSGAHYLDYALRSLNVEKRNTGVEKGLKIKELDDLRSQHSTLGKLYDYAPTMMGLIAEEGRIEEAKDYVEGLKSLFLRAQDFKRRYESEIKKEVLLSNSKGLESALKSNLGERLQTLKQLLTWKNDLEAQENTLNVYKIQLESNLKERTDEYLKVLGEAKLCPTCFSSLDELKLNEIKNNLIVEHRCLV